MRKGRRFWIVTAAAVLAGFIAVALLTNQVITRMRSIQRNSPGKPVVKVLGQHREPVWKDFSVSDFKKTGWCSVGPTIMTNADANRTFPASQRWLNQVLVSLTLPSQAGDEFGINYQIDVLAFLSEPDAVVYRFSVSGGNSSAMYGDRLVGHQVTFDDQTRILTVRVAWAFSKTNVAKECTLSFRLTPEGFVFIDPNGKAAASAPGGSGCVIRRVLPVDSRRVS